MFFVFFVFFFLKGEMKCNNKNENRYQFFCFKRAPKEESNNRNEKRNSRLETLFSNSTFWFSDLEGGSDFQISWSYIFNTSSALTLWRRKQFGVIIRACRTRISKKSWVYGILNIRYHSEKIKIFDSGTVQLFYTNKI